MKVFLVTLFLTSSVFLDFGLSISTINHQSLHCAYLIFIGRQAPNLAIHSEAKDQKKSKIPNNPFTFANGK